MIYGVVICFNPCSNFINNIKSYITEVEKLIIYRNSNLSADLYIKLNEFSSKIVFLGDGNNIGLSSALNHALNYANSMGATWLLTMDQDSSFNESSKLTDLLANADKNIDAIISPLHCISGVTNALSTEHLNPPWVMTSGNLININISLSIGGFDERLFIDGVDIEFCIRIGNQGYFIRIVDSVILTHALGDVTSTCKFGRVFVTTNHNSIRWYYIFRNYILIHKEYKRIDYQATKLIKHILLNMLMNLIFVEKDRFKKIIAIKSALIDFKNNKFGKL